MATPMDHVLDYAHGRASVTAPRQARSTGQRLLEQPAIFDYQDFWQHTLPMLDVIRARYGHLRVDQLGGSYGWSVRNDERHGYNSLAVKTMAEYIDAFRAGAADLPYLRHISVNRCMPALRSYMRHPAAFEPNWVSARWLDRLGGPEIFVGRAGTKFGCLHQDHASVHIGFVQLQGEKEFVLFPPDDGPHLYRWRSRQFPCQQRNSWLTYDDLTDYGRYPLLRHTHPRRLVLRAGQGLLVPADWWHTTLNLTDCVSYSIRIVNGSNIGRVLKQHIKGIGRKIEMRRQGRD